MPYGCDARGSATLCTTASVPGSTMLMLAASRFTTQMRPSDATATLRGATPTAISACFEFVTASKAVTVSLS